MDDKSIEDMAGGGSGRKPGPRMSREEQAERDEELVLDFLSGLPWGALTVKYDLSKERCRQIVAVWREHNHTDHASRDAIDVVYELLDTYDALAGKLATIADSAKENPTKVQAIHAQMSAIDKAVNLRQATGLLPKQLGTMRLELDARVMAHKIVAVLNDFDASPELKRAIAGALEAG